jgi:peptide-methionine (R)-S-oxide reductase
MDRRFFIKSGLALGGAALVCGVPLGAALAQSGLRGAAAEPLPFRKILKTDEEWKRLLTAEQYYVTRQKGTEAPYSSPLLNVHTRGVFACVSCALPLFSSRTKFDSQTGWPSFWSPINKRNVREEVDNSLGETRTEVLCNRCDAHLGHVFDDGPQPTGLRYCMNGVALKFVKRS